MHLSEIDFTELPRVETMINYLEYTGERPAYYLYEPKTDPAPKRPERNKKQVSVFDARNIMSALSLDENGFAIIEHTSSVDNFFNDSLVRDSYYAESANLVRKHFGAKRVHVFDHNVRNKPLSEQQGSDIREPVHLAHNDYTPLSGPQRVRDLMADEADRLMERRFAFINVWRPIRGPILDTPLGVCDANSIGDKDFVATDLKYEDRTGEIYSICHNSAHRWFYVSRMRPSEVMLLKCFDSATNGPARFTAHSAFKIPNAPADAPSRQSIEVRTVAFF